VLWNKQAISTRAADFVYGFYSPALGVPVSVGVSVAVTVGVGVEVTVSVGVAVLV